MEVPNTTRVAFGKCILLGELEKLRKANICFVMSASLSVHPPSCNNSAPAGRIFVKFDLWIYFEKSVKKIQVSLKSNTSNWYFTWRPKYVFEYTSFSFSKNEKCFKQELQRNKNTHFVLNNFFSKIVRLWDNVEKSIAENRPQMKIWPPCWITKATNTHSEYVILNAFPLQHLLYERAAM